MATAVVSAIVTYVVEAGGIAWSTAAFVEAVVVLAATYIATSMSQRSLGSSYGAEARDNQQIIRSATATRKSIYGQAVISGPLVYAGSSGTNNEYAHIVVPLAGHEVESIDTVWFGDKESTEYDAAYFRINKHLGSTTQAADTDLVVEVGEWTTDHKLSGIAYIYIRFKFSRDVWPHGLPNVKCLVKGKKVYDPRTSTTAWSDNWALCVRDYLTSALGLGAQDSEIDDAYVISAANICDEQVEKSDLTLQSRYTCNGIVDTQDEPARVVEQLCTAGVGTVSWVSGKYRVWAGAYTAPVVSLNEDNLRDKIKIRPRPPKSELFNTVRGTYTSPQNDYQTTDFPQITNSMYVTEDNEEVLNLDVDLPYTNDPDRAQRIAKVMLEKARQSITVEFPANFSALNIGINDTVTVSIDRLGWVDKEFRVTSWTLARSGGIDLVLQEEAAGVYAWNGGEATTVDLAPDTNLVSAAFCAAPTGLTLQSGSSQLLVAGDGTIISRILVTWTPPADAFVVGYEVQFKQATVVDWTGVQAEPDRAYITPVRDGERYDIRIRAMNSIGVTSDWVYEYNHTVIGKTEPPPSPDLFLVHRQADGTRVFSWSQASPPTDLAGYRIRYRLGSGWTWNDMTDLQGGKLVSSPYETNQLAAGTYTFAIVAVDTTGNLSTPKYIESDLADPRLGGVILSEYPRSDSWPGTKTSCWVDNLNILEPDDTTTWDTAPATWDAWTSWLSNPVSPIIYEHTVIDVGAVVEFTPLVTITGTGNSLVEISYSTDGISYSTWGIPSLITARYVKVKVTQTEIAPDPVMISDMVIHLSASPVTEEINDLDTSTLTGSYRLGVGDVRLPIKSTYSIITQVMVGLQNTGAGWTWEVIDKDTTVGPRIKIYDGTGTLADPPFIDVFVRGL